jgi:hypothetical protein
VEIVDLPEETDMYQEGERQKCRYRLNLQDIVQPVIQLSGPPR